MEFSVQVAAHTVRSAGRRGASAALASRHAAVYKQDGRRPPAHVLPQSIKCTASENICLLNTSDKKNNMKAVLSLKRVTATLFFYLVIICHAKILRNNALMNKMMSQFQKDNSNNLSLEPETAVSEQPAKVVTLMQTVLCKHFPTIPCDLIMQDNTLSRLIEKSIQQINTKKLSLEKTSRRPDHVARFPLINSEDLSNFLQVQNTGYFEDQSEKHKKKKQTGNMERVSRTQEHAGDQKKRKNIKRAPRYGRKKLRKFYPHKIKYKDKARISRPEFRDYPDEKMSMSVEVPDMTLTKQHLHYTYKREPADPSVWRIDYAKHGGPSLNFLGSITKNNGNNAGMEENMVGQLRKDVLHPDVYIKKNFIRKNSELVD